MAKECSNSSVSYTHLDVYKRQYRDYLKTLAKEYKGV